MIILLLLLLIIKNCSLLQFTKNFFFQMVRERRCGCRCFCVRAYLIPDLWSKEWHTFLSFVCPKKRYIQCHLQSSVIVIWWRHKYILVGWCYSFPVFKNSSGSTKLYSVFNWKSVYFPEIWWAYMTMRVELQAKTNTFVLSNLQFSC